MTSGHGPNDDRCPIFARAFVRKGRRCDAKIAVQGYGEGRVCLAAIT